MPKAPVEKSGITTVRDLLPHVTDDKTLKEVDEFLTEYVTLALRLYESLLADPERYALFKSLTGEHSSPTVIEQSNN